MTADNLHNSLIAAQEMIYMLHQELAAANSEFIALTLELEENMDQLKASNQRLAREIAERRQIEAALHASELRFRALVERSIDGIILLDRRGICTYASPAIESILGYAPAQLEGRSVFENVHPADLSRIQQDFLTCLANPGVSIFVAFRYLTTSNKWRYLEGTGCNQLQDSAVESIVVNYRDVTERRRAELRIYQLNRTLERQVNLRTAQLRMAYEFEATLKRITDKVRDSLDENQIIQTAVQELALAIPGCSCNAALYDLQRRTSTICYEHTQFPFSYRGRTFNMDGYPELYTQLLNGETCQFCSLAPNPERGKIAALIQPIADDQGVLGDLWLINQPAYSFREQDVKLVQQVANQCAIALRQSRLYQAAQAQVKELERLNQLKDDFLSTVSHELRAPMTNIKMAAQMLPIQLQSLSLSTTNPINRYVQILQDECNREISLINDLLDLARLDSTSPQLDWVRVEIRSHIQELATVFLERIKSQQQQLIVNIPDNLSPFYTHMEYFDRILTELLNNACKYTPSAGQIIITAREEIKPELLNLHTSQSAPFPQRYLLISVTNTGIEIPTEERDRIFDKFYRIPNSDPWKHGGTGLGLALVKKLAERLGCQIELMSGNQQTCFTLEFASSVVPEDST